MTDHRVTPELLASLFHGEAEMAIPKRYYGHPGIPRDALVDLVTAALMLGCTDRIAGLTPLAKRIARAAADRTVGVYEGDE